MEFWTFINTAVDKPEEFSECHISGPISTSHMWTSLFFQLSMSTTSTRTTSAVRDLTLGDELKITNCTCILVATQGNSTLFHPNSFQEEDIVQLCIGLSQVHVEGVLQLSDTKTVLTFQSSSEMLAVMHLFTAAMAWHNEPIKISVHPPTGA